MHTACLRDSKTMSESFFKYRNASLETPRDALSLPNAGVRAHAAGLDPALYSKHQCSLHNKTQHPHNVLGDE